MLKWVLLYRNSTILNESDIALINQEELLHKMMCIFSAIVRSCNSKTAIAGLTDACSEQYSSVKWGAGPGNSTFRVECFCTGDKCNNGNSLTSAFIPLLTGDTMPIPFENLLCNRCLSHNCFLFLKFWIKLLLHA